MEHVSKQRFIDLITLGEANLDPDDRAKILQEAMGQPVEWNGATQQYLFGDGEDQVGLGQRQVEEMLPDLFEQANWEQGLHEIREAINRMAVET